MENTNQVVLTTDSIYETDALEQSRALKRYGDEPQPVRLNIGIDAGSSENRSILVFKGQNPGNNDIRRLPNQYADTSMKEIVKYRSRSVALLDNLLIKVKNLQPMSVDSLYKEEVVYVMGSLLEQCGLVPERPKNVNKTSQDSLARNLFASIVAQAYEAHCRFEDTRNISINLGFVLPTKEVKASTVTEFVRRLVGEYEIELPRLGYKTKVKIENPYVRGESETAFTYYLISGKDAREKVERFKNSYVFVVDIGANTTDISVFKNRKLMDDYSETIKQNASGNYLIERLRREFADEIFYGNQPSLGATVNALKELRIANGSNYVPCVDIINREKEKLAHSIFGHIMNTIQGTQANYFDISTFIFIGRTTKKIEVPCQEEGVKFDSPSLVNYIQQRYYAETKVQADFVIIESTDDPNLLGLAAEMLIQMKPKVK